MVKDVCAEAINVVQCLMGKASHYNPFALCERIGISTITDKPLQKDGYLVCSDGLKLIFVSSNIQNQHRREFVVAHEIGHFLMHQEQLYCCSNVSVPLSEKVNSSRQEKEANSFATELLVPATELLPLLPNRSLCFSDISFIADYFDISTSHAAIKSIQCSKAADEVLLCYESGRLKWYTTNGSQEFKNKIPKRCPIDISVAMTSTYTNGAWDDLFEGSVHQEVFRPYKDKALILLSGIMIDSADWYNS